MNNLTVDEVLDKSKKQPSFPYDLTSLLNSTVDEFIIAVDELRALAIRPLETCGIIRMKFSNHFTVIIRNTTQQTVVRLGESHSCHQPRSAITEKYL